MIFKEKKLFYQLIFGLKIQFIRWVILLKYWEIQKMLM